jgi:hypothetical protein
MKADDLKFFEDVIGVENLNGGFGKEYNMFSLEQGILIAEALQTKEAILDFNKASWEEQKRLVPGLSDDHSGNTFAMACRGALTYLPQLIVNRRDAKIEEIIH